MTGMTGTAARSPDTGVCARVQLTRPGFTLDVDLQLPGRGVTVLFGPSGCGKTTVLRTISGLTRAAPGRVVVNGEVWQDDAARIWRAPHQRGLGYVFQEASLFEHLSVRGNIAYGLQRTPRQRRAVALDDAVALLGIDHLMDRKPITLSGGERQRVAMARALVTSPRVLLMDEPLAALDAQRKAEVLPYLERLHRTLDIPVIYVTHAPDEVARLASHLVLMENGRARAQGPASALLARLDLPLAHGDSAACIVDGHITARDSRDRVATVAFAGGELLLVGPDSLAVGAPVRLRIQARDVSLSLRPASDTSILNILPATVAAVAPDSPGQCMVALDLGATRLLARVTQRSAEVLALAPGQPVFAQIKGMALMA